MRISSSIKILLLIIGLTTVRQETKAQQNIQFTQYMFNALAVNPAYAGYKEEWYLQTSHRMQWMGIAGAPRTSQLSIDGVINDETKNTGLGLQMTADKLGAQTATSFYANYAYRIRLDETDSRRLSFGLAAGITQFGIDGTLLNPVNGADPELASVVDYVPNVRTGIYYAGPGWYIGVSMMDLLAGSYFQKLWIQDTTVSIIRKSHFYLLTGGMYNLTENIRFRPGLILKEDFKGPTAVDISSLLIFDNILWIGGSYRTGLNLWEKTFAEDQSLTSYNAVTAIIQLVIDDRFRIGYSYDFLINGLGPYQRGTHEITLGYLLRRKSPRILSPRFF